MYNNVMLYFLYMKLKANNISPEHISHKGGKAV